MSYSTSTSKIKEAVGLGFFAAFLVPIMQAILTAMNVTGLPGTILAFVPSLIVVVVMIKVIDSAF